ncbi:MAG: T9SS type A sorting domain-containing protein [Chitinophagales bacterium]|nr:T9SS type A sorting domain-containing protein [Chitinophagales bacterium]
MRQKTTYLILLFVFNLGVLSAQEVSTLVNASDKTFEAIHWHEDGRIYSVDFNNGRLYQIFTDGTVQTLLTGIANPAGGGFGEDGAFYYSALAAGTIHQYDLDGTVTTIATGLLQPTGILESNSPDTLYVGQYAGNSIVKVSKSSGQKSVLASGNGINGPDAVIYDGMGDLLVANFNNNVINRVSLGGAVSSFANLAVSGFAGYITRVGDHFYIPSIEGRRVYKISMDGEVELFAGNGSQGNVDGMAMEASFDSPNGIVGNPAGDTILVTDGNRIRMITNLTGPTSVKTPNLIKELELSPNPAEDTVEISWNGFGFKDATILEVIDMNGKVVHSTVLQATTTYQLSLKGISSGMYMVSLRGNNRTISRKLVVQ